MNLLIPLRRRNPETCRNIVFLRKYTIIIPLRDRNMLRRMKTNHECSWVQNEGITYYRYPSGIELMIRHSMEVWPQLHYVVKNGSYFFIFFFHISIGFISRTIKFVTKRSSRMNFKVRIYHANRKQDFMNIWLVVVKFQLNVQR